MTQVTEVDQRKQAKAAYDRERRAANPEKYRENVRRWSRANREKRAEANRRWREANPEKAAERDGYLRQWKQANTEKATGYNRRWREANPEKRADSQRRWKKANPGKVAEAKRVGDARRRARRVSALTVPFSAGQLAQRVAYWGNKCWMCGGPFEHVDHVIPLALGGPHCLSNLRPACNPCNARKGARRVARP